MTAEFTDREVPDLRLLVSFVAVARRGSVSAAAAALGYVPSAVSQHISSLERKLNGTELLIRKPGSRVVLTSAGRSLLDASAELFTATAAFTDVVRRIATGTSVRLRVGVYASALSHLVAPVMRQLQHEGVDIPISAFETEPDRGYPLVEQGDIDVLIAHHYYGEVRHAPTARLLSRRLGSEEIVVCSARDAPAVAPTPAALANLEWVAGPDGFEDRRMLERWAGAVGVSPRVRFETSDYHTALEVIASGVAVGLLPETVAQGPEGRDRIRRVPVKEGTENLTREVLALLRTEAQVATLEDFLNRVAGYLETMRTRVDDQ